MNEPAAPTPPSPIGKRAALLATAVGGATALGGSVLAAGITIAVMIAAGEPAADAASSLPVLVASMLTSTLFLLAAALVTPRIVRAPLAASLGLVTAPWPAYVLAVLGTLGLGPVSDLLMQLMARIAPELTFGGLDALLELMRAGSPWALLPVVALLPGLAEELFFRGMLQRALGRGAVAIAVSGLVFAAFHVDPHHVAGVVPLGLFLAWVAATTGSTWPCVVAHATNNGAALAATHLAPLQMGYGTDRPIPWETAAAGLLIATLAGWALRRETRR